MKDLTPHQIDTLLDRLEAEAAAIETELAELRTANREP